MSNGSVYKAWWEDILKLKEAVGLSVDGSDDGDSGDGTKTLVERVEELEKTATSVLVYKGQVASQDALPTDGNKVGDFYNVSATDKNYAWNGESWDDVSGIVSVNVATATTAGVVKLGTSNTNLKGYVGLNTSGQMQIAQATDDDYGVVKYREVVKANKWQGDDGKYYLGLNEGSRIFNMQNKPIHGVSNLAWDDGTSITFPSTSGEVALAADVEAAKTALATAVASEAARANTAEMANADAITAETTRAKAAEAALTTVTETNATSITANANAITAETTRAKAAEALLAPIASPTFTGTATAATLKTTGNATVGGTLSVTGATTLKSLVSIPKGLKATTATDLNVLSIADSSATDFTLSFSPDNNAVSLKTYNGASFWFGSSQDVNIQTNSTSGAIKLIDPTGTSALTVQATSSGIGSVSYLKFLKSDGSTTETLANLEARVAALEAAANSEADTTSDDATTIV